MTIVHCLNHYMPQQIAGTEVYVQSLAKALAKTGTGSVVLIPNYHSAEDEHYSYEGVQVIKYAEPSVTDRALMAGERAPDGLKNFERILKEISPAVVHFHELGGSNGITHYHVKSAKKNGFRTVMTFHIAKYSCRTGTLMYMNSAHCDGLIKVAKCSRCRMHDMGMSKLTSSLLAGAASVFYRLGYDTGQWKNSAGTALRYPFIIRELKESLYALQENCDMLVPVADWYYKVLAANGIRENKMQVIHQALPHEYKSDPSAKPVHSTLRMVFVGRINHFKGILTLIKAMKNITAGKVSLDIYGSSTEENYFNQCKEASAGMNNISWKGTLEPGNVINTIQQYDLFCLPSEVCEMSPLVIREAFAAGVPVLASDVYGNAEQITEGKNGRLFRFKDKADLEKKINELISDPIRITGTQPQRSFDDAAAEYTKLYQQILQD